MTRTRICGALAATALLCGATAVLAQDDREDGETLPSIVLGNGEENAIAVEGATRAGATFSIPGVTIARNGFLVMHPFRDGSPVGTEYVGAVAVSAGDNENVSITVDVAPETGDMYIIMLHFDMNDDQVFDFNDGVTVPDVPAFEGNTMIAHRFAAPADSAAVN
jgi:hypothetical protein